MVEIVDLVNHGTVVLDLLSWPWIIILCGLL